LRFAKILKLTDRPKRAGKANCRGTRTGV
jgi:hypothetical protein